MHCTSSKTYSYDLQYNQQSWNQSLSSKATCCSHLLPKFEKSWSSPNLDKIIRTAEQYLLKVFMPNSAYLTMNDLTYEMYSIN